MRKDTVRLTIDCPSELHTFLKMMAAKEGVSMRSFVLDSLSEKMEQEGTVDLDMSTFYKELSKMKKQDAQLMKKLSDR